MIDLKTTKVKSPRKDLEKRGYIDHKDLGTYSKARKVNLALLTDEKPMNRSIGAHQLGYRLQHPEVVEALLLQLDKEKALYTKIEITKSLAKGDEKCVKHMVNFLGKIGNNQYQQLPNRISKKKSYPLPRDIVARSIGNMNDDVLNQLIKCLDLKKVEQARELIDGIGYLCSKNVDYNKKQVFSKLYKKYIHCHDDVCLWKFILAFSCLKPASEQALVLASKSENAIIAKEALKALKQD